jgi:hypothetical protein
MSDNEPLDRLYLLSHAQTLFPGAVIEVIHTRRDYPHRRGRTPLHIRDWQR